MSNWRNMLRIIFLLAAVCHMLCFQVDTKSEFNFPLQMKGKKHAIASLPHPLDNNGYGAPPYIVQLYKALAKTPRPLPFGAQFVRSFSGAGRSRKRTVILKFNIRIPKAERILHATLYFCLKKETIRKITTITFTDVKSGQAVSKTRSELKGRACHLMSVTNLVRKKNNVKKTPLIIRVTVPDRAAVNDLADQWIRKVETPIEIIIFSSETRSVTPLLRLRFPSRLETVDKREKGSQVNFVGKGGCYRKSLIVNFVGLGYDDIVAPTIFDIKQCSGICQYPLGSMSKPTQHSLIQQLLHSLYGKRVAKSTCCSPKKYVPLTTMIKDSYSGRIAIRSLDEMIVADCGCQ